MYLMRPYCVNRCMLMMTCASTVQAAIPNLAKQVFDVPLTDVLGQVAHVDKLSTAAGHLIALCVLSQHVQCYTCSTSNNEEQCQ